MEKLASGFYTLDLREKPILDLVCPKGGLVLVLSDGRQAIISPDYTAIQLVESEV